MKVERRKKIIKILVPIFIIMSIIATSIYNYTLAQQAQNIKVTVLPKLNIDVVLTKGDSEADFDVIKEDLENKLKEIGIEENRVQVKISQEERLLGSYTLNLDDVVNNWPQYGAHTWSVSNGQIYSSVPGGYSKPNWWGTAILNPDAFDTTDITMNFTLATAGQLNEGPCFFVTINEDGSFNGYFFNVSMHHACIGTSTYECRLWRFDHYNLDQSFSSGINDKLWCWPGDHAGSSWTLGATRTVRNR